MSKKTKATRRKAKKEDDDEETKDVFNYNQF